MSQMSPLWWLSLFIMFTTIFILINSLNYWISFNSLENKIQSTNLKKIDSWNKFIFLLWPSNKNF